MAMATDPRRGVIEGSAAVLRELLKTPRIRRSIDVVLSDLDPENAPKLIDAIMEDPSIPFDLMMSAPAMINGGTFAVSSLIDKLSAYPPHLLRSFVFRVIDEINAESVGSLAGKALGLSLRLHEGKDVARALDDFGSGFKNGLQTALGSFGFDRSTVTDRVIDSGLASVQSFAARLGSESVDENSATAKHIKTLAEGIARIARENPEFIDGVVRPLVEATQGAIEKTNGKGEENAG